MVWQGAQGEEGGYGIQPHAELLRAVGGYDTAREKGPAPYPTGQKSGTQLASNCLKDNQTNASRAKKCFVWQVA